MRSDHADCVIAESWSELAAICRAVVRVAWMPRALAPALKGCTQELAEEEREPVIVHLRHPQRKNDLYRKFFRSEKDSRYQPLMADLETVIDSFWDLSRPRWLRFTLETPVDDNCRLFHSDNVELRLLCSYVGPGTQWLPESRLRREGLGKGNNDKVTLDTSPPFSLPTGAIGIFKGDRYPGNRNQGAVHRSPPIEGTPIKRLLLRVDAEGCRA